MSGLLKNEFNVLDMKSFLMEKFPKREQSKFDRFLMKIVGPLTIIALVLRQVSLEE